MTSVEAVGFGSLLAALQGLGLRGLCQVRLDARPPKFLNHVAPAGCSLHGDGDLLTGEPFGELIKPLSKALPVGGADLAAVYFAALHLYVVEGDLLPMYVETTYNVHFRGLLKLRYLPDTGMISSLASVLGRPPFTKLLLALAFSCHLFPRFLCFGVGLLRGGTGHLGVHRKPTEQGVDPLVLVADAPLALHPISGFDVGAKLPFSGASHQLPQLLLPTFAGRSIPARRGRAPSFQYLLDPA